MSKHRRRNAKNVSGETKVALGTVNKRGERSISKRKFQPRHVEAVFDAGALYLHDPASNRIFSSERDEDGNLVQVGGYDTKRRSIQFFTIDDKAGQDTSLDIAVREDPPELSTEASNAHRQRSVLPQLAFSSDPDDHCETSLEAYQHITPVLLSYCRKHGIDANDLQLYDPYFCTGKMVELLVSLGFSSVYNKNEDFYSVIRRECIPQYNVLLTNPPFSGTHIEKLLQYCAASGKPWALLMPTFVSSRTYYRELLEKMEYKPFYLVPRKRYLYWTPKGVQRQNIKARKDGRTSPYVTMWYVQLQKHNESYMKAHRKRSFQKQKKLSFQVYTLEELPDGILVE